MPETIPITLAVTVAPMIAVSDKYTETADVLKRLPQLVLARMAVEGLNGNETARQIGIGGSTFRNFLKRPDKVWYATLIKVLAWMGGE